jgi:hypothetical protein
MTVIPVWLWTCCPKEALVRSLTGTGEFIMSPKLRPRPFCCAQRPRPHFVLPVRTAPQRPCQAWGGGKKGGMEGMSKRVRGCGQWARKIDRDGGRGRRSCKHIHTCEDEHQLHTCARMPTQAYTHAPPHTLPARLSLAPPGFRGHVQARRLRGRHCCALIGLLVGRLASQG